MSFPKGQKIAGRQDHTALPSATALLVLRAAIAHETLKKSALRSLPTRAALSRPPHPRPNVRDDRDTPLCAGRDDGNKQPIWCNHEADSFRARDWTAQISLKGLEKLDFSRRVRGWRRSGASAHHRQASGNRTAACRLINASPTARADMRGGSSRPASC